MTNKPILIVLGEPHSIFSETLFKLYKSKIYKKLKKPIVLIGSKKLLIEQMLKLKFKIQSENSNSKSKLKFKVIIQWID